MNSCTKPERSLLLPCSPQQTASRTTHLVNFPSDLSTSMSQNSWENFRNSRCFCLCRLQPPPTCLPCQSFLKSLHFFTHCSTRVEQVIPLHLCETSDVHALYPSMDLQFLLFVFHKTHTCVQALKMGSWILCSLKEIERGSVITLSHTLPSPTYPTVVPA